MIGKTNGVAAVLKEGQENLIVVGCMCHLINPAAEKGAPCLPLMKFLWTFSTTLREDDGRFEACAYAMVIIEEVSNQVT